MSTTQKIFVGIVTVLAVLGGLAFAGVHLPQSRLAGAINNGAQLINYPMWFSNGTGSGSVVYAGRSQQWSVDDAGNETAASVTINGTLTTKTSVTSGNVNATSTTATSQTLVAADISGYSMVSLTPNTGALTLTLPASSTLSSFIPNAGNRTTIDIHDATGTAAATIAIVGATGVQLEQATSSAIKAAYFARLEFVRLPNTNIDVLYLAGF